MSCCCPLKINVFEVDITTTKVELKTNAVLDVVLSSDRRFLLEINPRLLPVNTLPVVLTDGTTSIPLTEENGNKMIENIFQPHCVLQACDCMTTLRCFYGSNDPHILVRFETRNKF